VKQPAKTDQERREFMRKYIATLPRPLLPTEEEVKRHLESAEKAGILKRETKKKV